MSLSSRRLGRGVKREFWLSVRAHEALTARSMRPYSRLVEDRKHDEKASLGLAASRRRFAYKISAGANGEARYSKINVSGPYAGNSKPVSAFAALKSPILFRSMLSARNLLIDPHCG